MEILNTDFKQKEKMGTSMDETPRSKPNLVELGASILIFGPFLICSCIFQPDSQQLQGCKMLLKATSLMFWSMIIYIGFTLFRMIYFVALGGRFHRFIHVFKNLLALGGLVPIFYLSVGYFKAESYWISHSCFNLSLSDWASFGSNCFSINLGIFYL